MNDPVLKSEICTFCDNLIFVRKSAITCPQCNALYHLRCFLTHHRLGFCASVQEENPFILGAEIIHFEIPPVQIETYLSQVRQIELYDEILSESLKHFPLITESNFQEYPLDIENLDPYLFKKVYVSRIISFFLIGAIILFSMMLFLDMPVSQYLLWTALFSFGFGMLVKPLEFRLGEVISYLNHKHKTMRKLYQIFNISNRVRQPDKEKRLE